jgi:hypothetical protein
MNKQNVVYPQYGVSVHSTTWMNTKNVMLRERNQSQKATKWPFVLYLELYGSIYEKHPE